MTIGPSASPSPTVDAKMTSARSAPLEPAEAQSEAPPMGDDVVQVGAFKALVGDYSLIPSNHRGGAPMVVIPADGPAPRPMQDSHTTRLVVGGTFAGAMGGAFVAASFASVSPLAGLGLFLGSTALGAAMGFMAGRNPRPAVPPGGGQAPPAA